MAPATRQAFDHQALHTAYERGPSAYDAVWSPVILPPAQSVVRALDLGRARVVLDVGAGTGALASTLRCHAPRATVLSIDLSPAMLAVAAGRGARAVVADAARLPVADSCADAVLLAYVLFHLADPALAVEEAVRALRPGGRVGAVTWGREWPSDAALAWDAWLDELGAPAIGPTSRHAGLQSGGEVAALLLGSGVADVRAWLEHVEVTFRPDSFLALRLEHGGSAVRLGLLDVRARADVEAELRRRVAELPPAAFRYRGEVVCAVGGIRPSA